MSDSNSPPGDRQTHGDLLARLEADPDMTLTSLESELVSSSPKLTRLIADYRAGLEALDLCREESTSEPNAAPDLTLVDGVQLTNDREKQRQPPPTPRADGKKS